jgi:tetratricopeptide (TPR) repeat protein
MAQDYSSTALKLTCRQHCQPTEFPSIPGSHDYRFALLRNEYMTRIFISYRRSGTAATANLLHFALQQDPLYLNRDEIFLDTVSIPLGKRFRVQIREAIARTEAFLVIIDDEWLNKKTQDGHRLIDMPTDSCRLELDQALERVRCAEEIAILPLIDGGLPHPRREDIPEPISEIVEFNSLRWDHEKYESCIGEVVFWVSHSLGLSRTADEALNTSSRSSWFSIDSGYELATELAAIEISTSNPPNTPVDSDGASSVADELLAAIRRADRKEIMRHQLDLFRWTEEHGLDADRAAKCKVLTLLAEAEFFWTAEIHKDGNTFETGRIRERIEDAESTKSSFTDAETTDRLLCLHARVDFIDGMQVEALTRLGESTSPLPFKFRLLMLQELGRLDDANCLLERMEPSPRWANVAIPIRFISGHEDKAAELLEWAISNSDEIAAHHCRLAMARCLHSKSLERFRGMGKISPAKLTTEELVQLGEVLNPLEAVIQPAIARGCPENGLEIDALEIAIPVAHLRSDREAARRFAKVLAVARPASTQAAQAFLWGYIPYSAELVANLRADRPTSFDANFLAMTMEFDFGLPATILVAKINALWSLAKDDVDKEQLAGFLVHFVPELPEDLRPTVIEPLQQAMGPDHEVVRLVRARQMFAAGHAEDAKTIADSRQTENPEWELLLADIAELVKDDVGALKHFLKAAETVTHPDLFWRAAIAASRLGDWPKTIELLESVLKLAPDRLKARRQLFQACMRVGSAATMRIAQEQLKALENAEPDVLEHVLNQAIVCMHLQKFPEALSLFDNLLRRSSAERSEDSWLRLSAVLHKVRIISVNSPAEAFSKLSSDNVRTEFRNQIAYWQAYMQFGHRAGQDAAAHDAMEQIKRLEEGLTDEQKSLWATDIEELKEILVARGKFLRELRCMVESGRCTISFLAMEENRPLVQEMIFRSQPMIVPDTEEHHGRFVTYASNGVILSPGNSGFFEATDPTCPAPESRIVIDPTSIFTLHRLGLLETALTRFENIRVPGHLISRFIEVVESLQPHQRSSRDAMLEAERLLISGEIKIAPHTLGHVIIEFDGEKDHPGIGVRHVVNWLYRNGQIGGDDLKLLQPLHFDDSSTIEQLAAAISSGPIHATTQALTTLARHQLLGTFAASTSVCVTEETRQEIVQSAKSYREFDGLRADYERMIQKLKTAPNIEFDGFNALAPDGDSQEDQINRRLEEAALSVRLAKSHQEHLLADDRVCQQMLANERESSAQAIFSSWQLLETLYDENRITLPQLAEAYQKLMAWRYRFFVPRADVLLYWALQYHASCPGKPLRHVAAYMMDCFSDPGLPHGLEPTSPPTTISARLFNRWLTVVVDIIAAIWLSRGFSLDQKKQFVSWILKELTPIPAANASPQEQTGLAHVGRQLTLSSVLVRLPVKPTNDSPSAVLLQLIRDQLGISKLEYFRTLGKTFQDLQADLHAAPEGQRHAVGMFLQRMAEHAVGADDGSSSGEFHVDHFEFGLLMSAGYLDGKALTIPSEFTSEQLAAISSTQHELRKNDHAKGPLCFFWKSKENKAVESVDVPTGLPHSQRAVREAICSYLSDLKANADGLLSEFSFKLFHELEPAIRSAHASKWYPAAISLTDTLQRDFLFNLAGFAQSLPLPDSLRHLRNEFANRVLNPPDHPAKYVSHDTFDVLATAAAWKKRVDDCTVAGDAERSIQNYVTRFRHLPLDGEYALAEMVRSGVPVVNAVPILLELSKDAHPLTRFQGCRTLCKLWSDLSTEQKAEAVTSIGKLFSLLFAEPTALEGYLWQCRKLLVRHYLYQCDLYEPGWPPDAITALAWKLADMVMEVITPHASAYADPISYVQRVCDEVIRPMTQARELVARLIRRPCQQSLYRLASLDESFGSPFGIGLLCHIEPAIPELLKIEVSGPVLKRAMSKLIIANGPFLPPSQNILFRTNPDQWSRLVETWLKNQQAPDREALSECVAQFRDFVDPEKLTEALRILPETDKKTRVAILYQIDRLAILDQLPHDPLWIVVSDGSFQKVMLKTFDVEDLKRIINAIVAVQQSRSPDWSWQLPYEFLNALKLASTAESVEVLVGGLLASTCRRHAYSVLSHATVPEFAPVVVEKLRLFINAIRSPEIALPSYSRIRIRQISMRI